MSSLIRNKKRVRQVIDFTGVSRGKIHPSDIDAVLEFDNEAVIFIEAKFGASPIPTGQRLLLERLTDSWYNDKSVTLHVTHTGGDGDSIPLADCRVRFYYHQGRWTSTDKPLVETLNTLGRVWGIDKLNFGVQSDMENGDDN